MHDKSQSEKIRFLMDRGIPSKPGPVSPYEVAKGVKAQGEKITARFIYKVLSGQQEITSMAKLEAIARFFSVPLAFFSSDPTQWLPPIPPHVIQLAVITSGDVTPEGKAFLASLATRAEELVRTVRAKPALSERSGTD